MPVCASVCVRLLEMKEREVGEQSGECSEADGAAKGATK